MASSLRSLGRSWVKARRDRSSMATCKYSRPRSAARRLLWPVRSPVMRCPIPSLVAPDRRPDVEGGEPAQPAPAQHDADGGQRPAEAAGDRRAAQALTAQRLDLVLRLLGQPRRAAMRPGGAVDQAGRTLGGMTIAPLADGLGGDAQGRGDGGHRPAGAQALDHQHSAVRHGPRILMDVHPGLRAVGCRPRNHSLPAQPRRDNLHSSDSQVFSLGL